MFRSTGRSWSGSVANIWAICVCTRIPVTGLTHAGRLAVGQGTAARHSGSTVAGCSHGVTAVPARRDLRRREARFQQVRAGRQDHQGHADRVQPSAPTAAWHGRSVDHGQEVHGARVSILRPGRIGRTAVAA